MKKFVYKGPTPCFKTVKIGNEVKELSLFPGEVYLLPKNSQFVKSMVAQKHLIDFQTSKTVK